MDLNDPKKNDDSEAALSSHFVFIDVDAGGASTPKSMNQHNIPSSKHPGDAAARGGGGGSPPGVRPLREQAAAFRALASPYFRESAQGRRNFAVIVVLALCSSGVRVLFSFFVRDFWNALGDNDADKFYEVMWQFVAAMLALTCTTRLSKDRRKSSISRNVSTFTGKVAPAIGSASVYSFWLVPSGASAQVPPPSPTASRAVSAARRSAFSEISVECAYPATSPRTARNPNPSDAS